MLESFWRHGSPEQLPGDIVATRAMLAAHGAMLGGAHDGFFVTDAGRWFSYHFWFYSLICLPCKAAIHLVHGDELGACAWTNAVLFTGTIALALRGRVSRARGVFVVLAAISPIVWYVAWPHAEVFEWACVVGSLCAFERGRNGMAAALAAVGSMQAPPIVALAVAYVGLAILRRRWRSAARAAMGVCIAGIPPLFFWLQFHCPSLILATGMADSHFASTSRVATLLFDLDQGMLRFIPITLVVTVIGVWQAPRRHRLEAVVLVVTALTMAAMASETCNFNAGCVGMNRYATWIAPVFAFVGTRNLRLGRPVARFALTLGLAAQLVLVVSTLGVDDAHQHNPLATLVLRRAPSLYNPDVETFAERTLQRPLDWPFHPLPLPIAFDHDVTKLLVDERTLVDLGRWYDVRDDWLAAAVTKHARDGGVFYVEPSGAVRRRATPAPHEREIVELGEGWSYAEGLPGHRFHWMGDRSALLVRRSIAGHALRVVGSVPDGLTSVTLRFFVEGMAVDQFVAPRHAFTRDIPLPDGGPDDVHITIEASSTLHATDGRDLGFVASSFGPPLTRRSIGGDDVHFSGAWHEPWGLPADETRCMGGDASITIDAFASRRSLWVFAIDASATPHHPAGWTVTVDGLERERGPVFGMARRVWSLSPNEAHTIRFQAHRADDGLEPDASLCFFALHTST